MRRTSPAISRHMKHLPSILAALVLCISALPAFAQIPISAGATITEPFTIGTSYNSPLPSGWKMDKLSTGARVVGTYAAAVGNADRSAGNNMSSSASNGMYNYAAGDTATSTDRAIGWMSSSSGTKSGNLYTFLTNNGTEAVTFTIGYNVEKYRKGSNTAGFAIQMYYSTDGSTWTSAGTSFLTTIPGDADNTGYASAPGASVNVPGTALPGVTLAAGSNLYLAWNFSVASGTTTSNAQGLAIDDVTITANSTVGPQPPVVSFEQATSSLAENGGITNIGLILSPVPTALAMIEISATGGTAVNGVDYTYTNWPIHIMVPPGVSSTALAIQAIDDAIFEGNKTLILTITGIVTSPAGSVGTPSQHTLTILENELPPDPTVVVNEYHNTSGDLSTSESVELIVVKDSLDMRGFMLSDATSSGAFPYGTVTFSNDALWSNLPAGCIIVVGGYISVPFNDVDPSDGLIAVQVPATWGTSNQYFTSSANAISIAGGSDAVSIRNATAGHIHGLAHGAANAATFPAGRHGWYDNGATSIPTGNAVYFSRTGAAMTAQSFNANTFTTTGTASIAFPNDAAGNRDFLRVCRSRSITAPRALAGTYFWDVRVINTSVTQTGPVNIGNSLVITEGTWNEAGMGLSADGSGNAQNGTGNGTLSVGDDLGTLAKLTMASNFGTVSGPVDFSRTDADVAYTGTIPQTILPQTYSTLTLTNGGTAAPKTLQASPVVAKALNINASAALVVTSPNELQLGPAGTMTLDGTLTGIVRTTRTITVGANTFGGLGITVVPVLAPVIAVPVTARLISGFHTWVGNLPSINRYHTLEAAGVEPGNMYYLTLSYKDSDLNGQTESGLAARFRPTSTGLWSTQPGTLNTTTNLISPTNPFTDITGTWAAHSTVPQGVITATPTALAFTAEELGSLPAAQNVAIANANGLGSLIEWTATSSMTTVTAPAWLRITPDPASGVNTGAFTIDVLRTDLPSGVYTGSITVTDPHAANTPLTIPVSYSVIARRKLCVGADTIFIKVSYRRSNPTKAVQVLNCGGAFGPGVIAWSVTGPGAPWLTISSTSGVEGQYFLLTANSLNMMPGTYVSSVTISGTNSVTGTPIHNSPLTLPVVLQIEPSSDVQTAVGPMAAGDTRTITNAFGHKVAVIRLLSGSVTSITPHMHPMQLPPYSIARKRYVYRWYTFDVVGSGYTAELTLFYTSNELQPSNILNPALIAGWRQPVRHGTWLPTASTSSPISNSVTITGITDLSGIWGMAAPFTAKLPSENFRGSARADGTTSLRWNVVDIPVNARYRVERSLSGLDLWEDLGTIIPATTGACELIDREPGTGAHDYRLSLSDDEGMIGEPATITVERASTMDGPIRDLRITPNTTTAGAPVLVTYQLREAGPVRMTLVDVTGREMALVVDAVMQAGSHQEVVTPGTLPSGMYFLRIEAGGGVSHGTMHIIR